MKNNLAQKYNFSHRAGFSLGLDFVKDDLSTFFHSFENYSDFNVKIIHLKFKDLMVIYLKQLSKTQLQLHEKLSTISVNQLKDYQKLLPE